MPPNNNQRSSPVHSKKRPCVPLCGSKILPLPVQPISCQYKDESKLTWPFPGSSSPRNAANIGYPRMSRTSAALNPLRFHVRVRRPLFCHNVHNTVGSSTTIVSLESMAIAEQMPLPTADPILRRGDVANASAAIIHMTAML